MTHKTPEPQMWEFWEKVPGRQETIIARQQCKYPEKSLLWKKLTMYMWGGTEYGYRVKTTTNGN